MYHDFRMYEWYITPEEYSIAANNGISRDTLEHRIRYHGWNKEEAINRPLRVRNNIKEWVEIAKENGISEGTFRTRIYKLKWSYEKAATTTKDSRKKYPDWVLEKLKENNIKYYTFLKRIELGWTVERACSENTWDKLKAAEKGREIQRKLNIGPYKSCNDFWKLKRNGMLYVKCR